MTNGKPKFNRNDSPPRTERQKPSEQKSMEDQVAIAEERVKHLMTLNATLLEQATEKESLDRELARLREEVDQVSDANLVLAMEMDLDMLVVGNQVREVGLRLVKEKDELEDELEDEIRVLKDQKDLVCEEMNSLKIRFDLQCKEVNQLKECVVAWEKREYLLDKVNREKDYLKSYIGWSRKDMEILRESNRKLLNDKSEMEKAEIEQANVVAELKEDVMSLMKEKSVLQNLVMELEENIDESSDKEKDMTEQIAELGKVKTAVESELKKAMLDHFVVKTLLGEREKSINKLSGEKGDLEGRMISQEAELLEAEQKVYSLNNHVALLEIDCEDRTKASEKLTDQVKELRKALKQAELKKEEVEKALDQEKSLGKVNAEKTARKELEKVKTENESVSTEKNALESESESLKSEKAILENNLVELQKAVDALKADRERFGMLADRSLEMLKSVVPQPENQEDGAQSYEAELEAIENALKGREDMIEEMKRTAATMKKKKDFWTLVSQLTTISAVVSFIHARTR